MDEFTLYLLLWIIIGALVGTVIGQQKDRAGAGLLFGLLLGPIGWLIIAAGPNLKPKCTECGGIVPEGVNRCMHCGQLLVTTKAKEESEKKAYFKERFNELLVEEMKREGFVSEEQKRKLGNLAHKEIFGYGFLIDGDFELLEETEIKIQKDYSEIQGEYKGLVSEAEKSEGKSLSDSEKDKIVGELYKNRQGVDLSDIEKEKLRAKFEEN